MKPAILSICVLTLLALACKKSHDGLNSLIDFQNFSSNENCPSGGLILKSGLDANRNNLLEDAEVSKTTYLCNGQNATLDKQIFLSINYSANSLSTTPVIGGELLHFSKLNYPGVDSIIFVANPYVGDNTNTSVVELYNMTDNAPIVDSKITSNKLFEENVFLHSGNLYSQLPDKEIRLGIRFNSGTEGKFAATGSCYLILYRK